jgi:carboxypeptidase T
MVTNETIGTSWENRSIVALRITGPEGGAKKNLLFMGLHHASEWMSMEVVMYLIHYFLANAKATPRIRAILDKSNVWFIPLVNPDGYEYSRVHDSLWRKNRRDNGDGTIGVDLNRNYGYQWNTGGFASDGSLVVTSSIEYPGPSAFSEPETRAVAGFAVAHPPVFSTSYHTAGEWILFPWSYTRGPTSDDGVFRAYAQEMAATNGYRVLQEGHSNHNKPGNSDDWLYHSFGTLAFTYEVGPGFSSQDEQQITGVVQANVESAVHGAELSLNLTQLSCTPQMLLCVPRLGVISLAIPGLFGAIFFGLRVRRRRADRLNQRSPEH